MFFLRMWNISAKSVIFFIWIKTQYLCSCPHKIIECLTLWYKLTFDKASNQPHHQYPQMHKSLSMWHVCGRRLMLQTLTGGSRNKSDVVLCRQSQYLLDVVLLTSHLLRDCRGNAKSTCFVHRRLHTFRRKKIFFWPKKWQTLDQKNIHTRTHTHQTLKLFLDSLYDYIRFLTHAL